ncbi:hypothetical protein HPB52_021189 [Rhipicephalus sanguineus]|uniref:Uncharacterized protein n=1 Tax=Rhipicephalus sanguineus TaxID=34632 RepID=A0A9D4PYT3_RHISA|nr:hypothetical protein HPB52_021189 [Rhipicephalus sanguineus]
MPKKQEDGKEDPPKAVREKRQSAAAAGNAPGPSNEAPAAKPPRGRPPKALSVEPRAPKPIASTAARELRKADAAQPENEVHSTSREVPSKATRAIRKKRSRSRSPSSANETESEAPRRRSAKRRAGGDAAMPKKQEDGKEDPPKTVREKRQSAAAADNAPGPSNEAPAAKRPRGRPPKALSVEPRAPKPIASTAARKLRKADAAQPANEGHSTSREVPSKATRAIRKKRSRSRSPSSANETESEAPRHRSAKRRAIRLQKERIEHEYRLRLRDVEDRLKEQESQLTQLQKDLDDRCEISADLERLAEQIL